jgi:hypothetical protein
MTQDKLIIKIKLRSLHTKEMGSVWKCTGKMGGNVSLSICVQYNLISRMAVECCWDVESGKLMYPSISGHVPTCVYM